jgi:hypothetical protein
MRQWMVDPKIMCRQHLLGEHLEHHMFVGSINRRVSMDGFIKNDLLEPHSLKSRHDALVEEMQRRGYNHKSPLQVIKYDVAYHEINRDLSLQELIRRCPECKTNHENR